jgi:hypothetical protein
VYDREDYSRELMYPFGYDLLTEMHVWLQRTAKAYKDFSDLTSMLGEASQLQLLNEEVSVQIYRSFDSLPHLRLAAKNNSKTFPVFITKHIPSFFATKSLAQSTAH